MNNFIWANPTVTVIAAGEGRWVTEEQRWGKYQCNFSAPLEFCTMLLVIFVAFILK